PQTIAIVDAYDDPTAKADLDTYDATYGLPPFPACATVSDPGPCFVKVNQSGRASSYPPADQGWALEESLDVQVAHAVCQNCKIVLVEANSATLRDVAGAEDTAVSLGANA